MSRRVQLFVECEDALHRSFITRFLRDFGLPEGKNPDIQMRGRKGNVLNSIPARVKVVRNANVTAHLLVVVDADNWADKMVVAQINKRLEASGQNPLQPTDRVLVIVVGRTMDTWVRHLRGESVKETGKAVSKLKDNSEGRSPAGVLAAKCKKKEALTNALPSLEAACKNWNDYLVRHGLT